jgi:hypothetical protein
MPNDEIRAVAEWLIDGARSAPQPQQVLTQLCERLVDHIAEIDADAQFDAAVRRDTGVALGYRLLHRDRAAHRIDDAGKFHQHSVAGGLDDAAMMLGDFGSSSSRRSAI